MRLIALLLVVSAGCAHRPALVTTSPTSFIKLERLAGMEPGCQYTVTLFSDGVLTYAGDRLCRTRLKTVSIRPDNFVRLVAAWDAIGERLAWKCDPNRLATDFDTAIVTLSRGDIVSRVEHYQGDPRAPQDLWLLEQAIDGISSSLVP